MSKKGIIFENRGNEYVAKNAKIDDFGLSILEERYGPKGIGFYNDDFDNEAVMDWFDWVEKSTLVEAQADFQNYIVHA